MIEQPQMVKICNIKDETPNVKTFFFEFTGHYDPGQFIMVWIPLNDEKPFTLSYINGNIAGITVLRRGDFTKTLHAKKIGDQIGIRGPYGKGYGLSEKSVTTCIVGGGIGMASIACLADRQENATFIQGARTVTELLFRHRFKEMKLCTDDGSLGYKGTTVDLLRELIGKHNYQKIYACGPEKMLHKIFELCSEHHIDCEVSVERYIKCGFGICGQCDCSGQRICIDGPVFNKEDLRNMPDFGKTAITKSGSRVSL
ncbi:MAG: dihydroorotate dehydrogenase electron transfer subunit [Candidatus Kuenenia sp.]|nr:dihydroorotate dehydrogenase electron transfer subunit [Candidatus Kuenenia hertensis]